MKSLFTALFMMALVGCLEASQELTIKSGSKAKTLNYYFIEDIKNPQIDIDFRQKIFSPQKIGTFTNEKIMICSGGLGGSFEYLGENNITFYPETKLTTSQSFNCKLNKKLFPKKSRKIIIKTEEFKLNEFKLKNYHDKLSIKLEFNDKVDFSLLTDKILIKNRNEILSYEVYPKNNSFNYTLIFNSPSPKFNLVIEGLKNSSGKIMDRFTKKFNTENSTDFFLQSYSIKDFPMTDEYDYSNGSIKLKFQYLGEIVNKNIKNFIEITPKVDFYIVKHRYYWDDESTLKFFGDFSPQTEYKIKFKKGLKFDIDDIYKNKRLISRSGIYELKDDITKTLFTKNRSSFIDFNKNKNYLSSKAKSIIIKSTNIESTKIVIEKLIDENYRYFINFADSYEFYKYSDVIFNKKLNINCKENKICSTKLNLDKFLKGSGIYRIKIYSDEYSYKNKYLYLSDIAVSAKLYNKEILVSTSSLATNEPLHNAKISIYDDKNRLLADGRSDYRGIFRSKFKNIDSNYPASVIVSFKDEKNFLRLNNSTAIDGNIVENPTSLERVDNFIYLDREIARPNDMINALFVLKNSKFKSIKNTPLKITILDPIGSEVFNKITKTDDMGIIEESINIPNSYKTGKYKISVFWFKEKVGYKEFMVEDFIPHKIKNKITLNQKSYNGGENIKLKAQSNYLFGASAGGLKAQIIYTTVNKEFKNGNFKGYSFTNNNRFEKLPTIKMERVNKNIILDKEGKADVIFQNGFKKVPSMMQGMVALTVFDDGRGVSKYKTFNIFPYKSMVGIKRLNSSQAESGVSEKFKIALVDSGAKMLPNRKLQLEIKKAIWLYGSSEYSIEVLKKDIINSADELEFTANSSGNYLVTITDPIDGHSATNLFYVSGWSYDPANIQSAKKVEILIEDKEYRAGDKLQVAIKSPIAGRLILTLEDEKLHHQEVIELKNNTATLNLQIPYAITDNFYITAYVIRDTSEDNQVVPYRAFGKKFVKFDRSLHKVKINMTTLKKYKSKSKVEFLVKSDAKRGYAILSVVDMGILNIIGQMPPKPFDFYLTNPYNISSFYDFYNNLLSHIHKTKIKQGSGESLHSKMKKHSPPDSLTKRVKPFAFYSKKIALDNGEAKIMVDIPNFNGQARVVAIVVENDRIGSFSKEIIVKDDVIIKPTYPRFLSIGDELQIPVRVFNTTNQNKTITLKASGKNSKIVLDEKFMIKAKSSILKDLNLTALKSPNTHIRVDAKDDTFHDYFHEVDIPTKSTKSLKTFSKGGETNQTVAFSIDQKIFDMGTPKVSVMVSNTMLSQFNGDFDSLISYPYGCAEQTSSKILAMLNIDKFLDSSSPDYANKSKQNQFMIMAGVNKLSRMQKQSGEFTYWKSGTYVNDFASIYASDVLLEAKQKGFKVSDSMVDGIKQALDNYSRNSKNSTKRLYSLYLLSKQNKIDLALVNSLYDNKSYKNNLYEHYLMAILLKRMNLENESKKVYAQILDYDLYKQKGKRTYSGNFYSFIKDISFSLYLHLENFPKNEMSQRLFEIVVDYVGKKQLYSTQDKAFVLRSLDSYYKGQKNSKLDAIVTINSKRLGVIKPQTQKQPLTENLVEVTPKNGTSVNYLIDIIAYDEYKIKNPKSRKERLKNKLKDVTINTNYYDDKGMYADLENLKVGDKIYLEVKLHSKMEIENVVVNAQIPSNLEIVNIRLDKENNKLFKAKNFTADFIDIRDDRELVFLTVKGKVKFYIPLRAVSSGKSKMPPVLVEAMYDSRINDYSKKVDFVIVK